MIPSIANSLGFGSGIDVRQLVSDLAAASRAPKAARFDARAQAVQASISAVAQARADLDGFATSLSALIAGGTLQSQPIVSDATVLDARAKSNASIGALSAQIEVTRLARGQTLASGFLAASTDPVGVGALTLTMNGRDFSIAITAANDSLDGLASAINGAGSGVTATVASDTAGVRLVLKGPTGAVNNFTIAQASGSTTLDRFTSAQLTPVQTALDANFTVDGLTYTRPNNVVDDVIAGVSFTMKKVAAGTLVNLGVARPGDTLKTTLANFVSVFNELKASLNEARSATKGDQAIGSLERQLAQLVSKSVTSGSGPQSLSAIGVKTNRDGTIMLDEAVFTRAYAADPNAVEAIFVPPRDATRTALTDPGIGGAFEALKSAATGTTGPLTGVSSRLGKEAAAIAVDRQRMEARETAYAARLERQFGSVDARVGALRATQSYLDQQIKLWTQSR
ncbi:MAG: flagellar filament capping protein FliD [Sphingomonadaceae bacterium]